jgi:hypothetical protein
MDIFKTVFAMLILYINIISIDVLDLTNTLDTEKQFIMESLFFLSIHYLGILRSNIVISKIGIVFTTSTCGLTSLFLFIVILLVVVKI